MRYSGSTFLSVFLGTSTGRCETATPACHRMTLATGFVRIALVGLSRTLSRHEYIEVVEYPDGTVEVQAAGVALSCTPYDRIAPIEQGTELENKRLAHALEVALSVQAKRDDRRASGSPSRTHRGEEVRAKKALVGLKKQRALDLADINEAILQVSPTHWNLVVTSFAFLIKLLSLYAGVRKSPSSQFHRPCARLACRPPSRSRQRKSRLRTCAIATSNGWSRRRPRCGRSIRR
jgi:hypothetical protein